MLLQKKLIIGIILLTIYAPPAKAQVMPLHEVQAAIIFNVLRFTQWPNETINEPFILGVRGDQNLFATLKTTYQNKFKGSRPIVVNDLQSIDDVSKCNLLFLGESKLKEFQKAKEITSGKPILCITGAESYGKKGAGVNLTIVDDKMVIEINETTISQNGLKISSTLLSMAKIIR